MKLFIKTLGCPKNVVDSEILISGLLNNKFELVQMPDDADVIIINTCAFILSAREEAIEVILEAVEYKKHNQCSYVYVVGCLPQKYKIELEKEIPEVDAFFDQLDFSIITEKISNSYYKGIKKYPSRYLITPKHYAYLKIAEGCNNKCSYCTIPLIKGAYTSSQKKHIVSEAKSLVENGVKELILIAQDTTYYGRDLTSNSSLKDIISELSEINDLTWLRLLYAHPAHFSDDLLKLFIEQEKLCRYIDLPIQHISDRILKSMKRKVTSVQVRNLIELIREKIPNIAIRTTLMVGYPGETREDFESLYGFVDEMQFERLGVFKYSDEDNTHAYTLKNKINEDEKEDRFQELMELQNTIAYNNNKALIGKKIEVIIDQYVNEGNYYIARSEWDSPEIDNQIIINEDVEIGSFRYVNITDVDEYELKGTLVN